MTKRAWTIVVGVVTVLLAVSLTPWISSLLNPGSAAGQRPSDAQQERLAAERVTVGDSGSHRFMAERDDGSPVRYDPCAPIHVWTNADIAPRGTDGLVSEALDAIADATGLVFVDEGATSAAVIQDLPERTEGWRTDVIIVWATPEDEPDLAGDTAGMGGSLWWRDPDWYEGGSILLDAPQLADILDSEGADAVLAVIMHEVAHVVGLGHVDDPLELMHPQARRGVLTFGPGDLAGLAMLGSGGCRPY